MRNEAEALRAIERGDLPALFDDFESEIETPHVKKRRARPSGIAQFESPARFLETSSNRKLSPVDVRPIRGSRAALEPRAPFCCSTYSSIEVTCSSSCPFKAGGCYAKAGFTGMINARMDQAAAGRSALEVAREEARLIDEAFGGGSVPQDGARGGRDLRLHVGGDALDAESAEVLAAAARSFRERGGGTAWTYTHGWRVIEKSAWRGVTALASVEVAADIERARERGYAAAIVVPRFPNKNRVFSLEGSSARVVPCPAETASVTCVQCRLCLDADLLGKNLAIAFSVHGAASAAAKRALRVLNDEPEPQLEMFAPARAGRATPSRPLPPYVYPSHGQSGKYVARVPLRRGGYRHLGTFDSVDGAVAARRTALAEDFQAAR